MPQIRVGQLPGQVQDINVPDGTTVAAAIQAANINSQGFEIRHQGKQLGAADAGNIQVAQGDTIILTKRITGNLFRRIVGNTHQAACIAIIERGPRTAKLLGLCK